MHVEKCNTGARTAGGMRTAGLQTRMLAVCVDAGLKTRGPFSDVLLRRFGRSVRVRRAEALLHQRIPGGFRGVGVAEEGEVGSVDGAVMRGLLSCGRPRVRTARTGLAQLLAQLRWRMPTSNADLTAPGVASIFR